MRLDELKQRIAAAAEKSGRTYGDITVVCATKMRDLATVRGILEMGFNQAGENRVQEFLAKYAPIEGVEWQFIGQLQTNKVKYIADKVSLIQSVDRISLAEEINRICAKTGKKMSVLAEINIAETAGRGGVGNREALRLVNEISSFPYLSVEGLMTVLPLPADGDRTKTACLRMKELFEDAKAKCADAKMTYLSMGMSDDFETAIENGANMVRLGRVLFGER